MLRQGSWSFRAIGGALAAVAALVVAGCSSPPPPAPPQDVVMFSATGTAGGAAFGRYAVTGTLGSNSVKTFTGLPFTMSFPVVRGIATPSLSVSLVDVAPGSRLSCQITINDEVVASQTVSAPGQDATCTAPGSG